MSDADRPVTRAELQAMEREMIAAFAEANEGLVLAMSALCLTLVSTGAITGDALIAHLRATTEVMMRDRKSALTQEPVDQIVYAIQQLSAESSPADVGH